MFERYWPMAVAVISAVFYHIASKSTPPGTNVFASLTITYLIAAALSAAACLLSGSGGLIGGLRGVNWTAVVLGAAIVGLEAATIFMYKVGWNVNTGYIVRSIFIAAALLAVGSLLYREELTPTKIAGVAVCLAGLFLLNR